MENLLDANRCCVLLYENIKRKISKITGVFDVFEKQTSVMFGIPYFKGVMSRKFQHLLIYKIQLKYQEKVINQFLKEKIKWSIPDYLETKIHVGT